MSQSVVVKTAAPDTNQEFYKRRKVPRRAIENRIGLMVSGAYFLSWAYDIGEGGMSISSSIDLKLQQKIVISIRIPGVIHSVITATVLYKNQKRAPDGNPLYGVQFDNIHFEVKRQIRNFVASATKYAID